MGGAVDAVGDVVGGVADTVGSVIDPVSSAVSQIPVVGPIAGPVVGAINGGPLGFASSVFGNALTGGYNTGSSGGGGSQPGQPISNPGGAFSNATYPTYTANPGGVFSNTIFPRSNNTTPITANQSRPLLLPSSMPNLPVGLPPTQMPAQNYQGGMFSNALRNPPSTGSNLGGVFSNAIRNQVGRGPAPRNIQPIVTQGLASLLNRRQG